MCTRCTVHSRPLWVAYRPGTTAGSSSTVGLQSVHIHVATAMLTITLALESWLLGAALQDRSTGR